MRVLIVSGLSGAGKSTCLDALEDLGDYCIDNIPAPLLPQLVALLQSHGEARRVVVGIDAREAEYLDDFEGVVEALAQQGHEVQLLFLEASVDVLVRRYSETRRMHPMGELPEAVGREQAVLGRVRKLAGATIDTSLLSGRQLRQLVRDRFASGAGLRLVLMSFGFRNGLPSEADLVLDARFLLNPYDHAELRPLSGLQAPVSRFVLAQPDAQELLDRAESLIRFTAPRALREGRSYLTVALGCTGGQHRSVSLVEELHRRLLRRDPLAREGDDPSPAPPPVGGPSPSLPPAASLRTSLRVRHRDIGRA